MEHARSARRDARLRRGGGAPMPDRISALPDELLHHVMSSLPARESVATRLLARRWRGLWKSVPALSITGAYDNPNRFVRFVNSLLFDGRDPDALLDSFELDLHDEEGYPVLQPALLPDKEAFVDLWFRQAVALGARALVLRTDHGAYKAKENAVAMELMPDEHLISHHLAKLDLRLVHLSGRTLDFSGCPTLLDLRLDECNISGDIRSPSLKHLSIDFGSFLTGSVRARICLPRLVSLELIEIRCRAPLLERMPLLVSATVRLSDLSDSCPRNECGDCDVPDCHGCYDSETGANDRRGQSLLLVGLSEAAELELSVYSQVFVVNRDLKLRPTFSKLKTLLLSNWCPDIACDLSLLGYFLQHSPILEKLTLQLSEVPKIPVQTQTRYSPSEQSFECSQLKIIEIECDEAGGETNKILDILGTYGIPLEKLRIQPTSRTS